MTAREPRIPIDKRESERLELKAAAALGKPERIAREVVAMLNAGGGEVWVGLREKDGVAVEIEPIENPEAAGRRLQDSLVDSIEPSPTHEEVRIETVGTNAKVLRIRASGRQERRPYAVLLAGGGRLYVVRVGARIRSLTREEIRHPHPGGERGERGPEEGARLAADLRNVLMVADPTLWLGIEPADSEGRLDLHRLSASDYLLRPESTENRRLGSTFYLARHLASLDNTRYLRREGGRDGMSWLVARGGAYELKISETAAIRAIAPLAESFTFGEEEPHPRLGVLRGQSVLDPRAILEYPTSVVRLLSTLLRDDALWDGSRPRSFRAAFALIGIDGWFLRPDPEDPYLDPRSPDPRSLRLSPPGSVWAAEAYAGDSLQVGPLSLAGEEIAAAPDGCAYRLLRVVFAAFGYAEEDIRVFDPTTRRFRF